MIFRTFDTNKGNGLLSRIGIFGNSFDDILNAKQRRQEDIDLLIKNSNGEINKQKADAILSDLNVYRFGKEKQISPELLQQYDKFQNTLKNSDKTIEQVVQGMGTVDGRILEYSKNTKKANMSTIGFINSLKEETVATKAMTVATNLAAIALNTLITMGVTIFLNKIITKISEGINAVEAATDSLQEYYDKITDGNQKLKTASEFIEKQGEEYKRLSDGVDVYGNNISLTNSEYNEYLKLSEQVAQMFPNLAKYVIERMKHYL